MHLREEIKRIQSQMKSAIQNHQMIVFKLKDRPVSTELRVQMNNVQRHIVSLGERQKSLLQELRKTLEANGGNIKQEMFIFSSFSAHKPTTPLPPAAAMKAIHLNVKKEYNVKKECIKKEDYDGNTKHSVPRSLKSQENHPKTTQPQKRKFKTTNSLPHKNGHITSAPSPSRKESTPSSTPSSSPTHGLGSLRGAKQRSIKQENSCPPTSGSDESQDAFANLSADPEVRSKLQFMTGLGLITRDVLAELQSRRTERKRRSTANPQFLYGNNIDQAMKRKKTNYLISNNSVAPDTASHSIVDELNKLVSCVICSSGKSLGLTTCASCKKVFHWNCAFETPQPKSGTMLECNACQKISEPPVEVAAERNSQNKVVEECEEEIQPIFQL